METRASEEARHLMHRIVIWIKMSVAFLNSTIICILSTRGGVCECETNKSTVTRIF